MSPCHSCHGFVTSLRAYTHTRVPRRKRVIARTGIARARRRCTARARKANCIVTGAATGAPLINARDTVRDAYCQFPSRALDDDPRGQNSR